MLLFRVRNAEAITNNARGVICYGLHGLRKRIKNYENLYIHSKFKNIQYNILNRAMKGKSQLRRKISSNRIERGRKR